MLAINRRLKLVASFVKDRRLADIGSDHAYLPIYLAKKNKIDFAVAGEIVEGPHKVSIKNVKEESLSNIIECRKAAGLDAIELEDNIEVITICGMGGKLIAEILEKGKDKLLNKPNLILQPNVGENFVRRKLQELGYKIIEEEIIEEDGHIYEIIVACSGEMKLTEDEKNFGKFLLNKKSELFIKKQKLEQGKIKYILSQLEKANEIQSDKVEKLKLQYKKIEDIISQ
ncbi:tRNA (adenine(22)-N(1))-methyltransferase [Gemella cuniculi]|uniref:tRNA (adenine(22)-N(1))-methyltransferase n=1 Tax=Gemella cuniculi TaxID=150240 RepID=UPI00042A86B2|nr:tRNA (adenine(22)-N(1))-methyltransferase TrmK [Gemella cuniculi]